MKSRRYSARQFLKVELSARGIHLLRENDFFTEVGEETREKLEEMNYPECSIGAPAKLAIKPFLQMSRKDLWQFYMRSK